MITNSNANRKESAILLDFKSIPLVAWNQFNGRQFDQGETKMVTKNTENGPKILFKTTKATEKFLKKYNKWHKIYKKCLETYRKLSNLFVMWESKRTSSGGK